MIKFELNSLVAIRILARKENTRFEITRVVATPFTLVASTHSIVFDHYAYIYGLFKAHFLWDSCGKGRLCLQRLKSDMNASLHFVFFVTWLVIIFPLVSGCALGNKRKGLIVVKNLYLSSMLPQKNKGSKMETSCAWWWDCTCKPAEDELEATNIVEEENIYCWLVVPKPTEITLGAQDGTSIDIY